jgi:hypothetical protein
LPRRRRDNVSKSDDELAASAKAAIGGPAKLAQMFNVSKQAASEWGRVRPIPRHVRPRLQQLVQQRAPAANESPQTGFGEPPWQSLNSLIAGTDLQLTPPLDERRSARARGAWHVMTEEQKNALRSYVRGAAMIASAVQGLLSNSPARKVIANLGAEVSNHINNELLRFAR